MLENKVLVTGISGFVGQHCATELLRNGYLVRGSVRNLAKEAAIRTGIDQVTDAKDSLEFCVLDLMDDKGWDEAMKGCKYVLHVASPYMLADTKDDDVMIKPAVEGTLRALRAAKKAGVKRVVLTSSTLAMAGGMKTGTIDPTSWTDLKSSNLSSYMKSKTLAEKAAWDFVDNQSDDHKLELAVVNPGPIFGPTLTNDLSGQSLSMMKDMITGKMPPLPKARTAMVDVRDVAKIHRLAMENERANGKRFIANGYEAYSFQDVAQLLKENGYDKVKTKVAPSLVLKFIALFNNEVKGLVPLLDTNITSDITQTTDILGWQPMPFKKTVLDTAESVKKVLQGQ